MHIETPFSAPQAEAAAKANGATVNDALMSALSGALRRVEMEKMDREQGGGGGIEEESKDMQAVIWVSLRSPKEMFEPVTKKMPINMDNAHLGAVYVHLPLSVASPEKRLAEMSSRIRPLTTSLEPLVANRILTLTLNPSLNRWSSRSQIVCCAHHTARPPLTMPTTCGCQARHS